MPRETVAAKRERAIEIARRMNERYPKAECALHYDGEPFRLVIAVLLSAQTTDKGVNKVTPALFERYPTVRDMAAASVEDVYPMVKSCGFKTKAANIVSACRLIMQNHGGEVPGAMEALTALPGVGRKIANLVRGDLYGQPGIVADTHCIRICNLLGLASGNEKAKVEQQLRAILPPEESSDFCHRIVLHGRAVCTARKPDCESCTLRSVCQFAEQQG